MCKKFDYIKEKNIYASYNAEDLKAEYFNSKSNMNKSKMHANIFKNFLIIIIVPLTLSFYSYLMNYTTNKLDEMVKFGQSQPLKIYEIEFDSKYSEEQKTDFQTKVTELSKDYVGEINNSIDDITNISLTMIFSSLIAGIFCIIFKNNYENERIYYENLAEYLKEQIIIKESCEREESNQHNIVCSSKVINQKIDTCIDNSQNISRKLDMLINKENSKIINNINLFDKKNNKRRKYPMNRMK